MVRSTMLAIIVAGIAVAVVAGCSSGGGVGMTVKKPAAERPDVDGALAARGALLVPQKEPFNLTSFTSGQSGSGRGVSEATGGDGATCRAEVRDRGSAWAEFQLGYCFDNVCDQPLDATIRVRASAKATRSYNVEGGSGPQVTPSANTILTFFIKDTNGVAVKKEVLLTSDLDKGPNATIAPYDLVFDARFEAKRGYYLVLAGRAEAESSAPGPVSCVLEATGYSFEVAWRPTGAPEPHSAGLRAGVGANSPTASASTAR